MIEIPNIDLIENIQEAIFPVFKPLGWTSFDVCNFLKGKHKIKKIGHCGTLDPLACGVIVICTGKNTKRISQIQTGTKKYKAKICFGATTDTLDTEQFPNFFSNTSDILISDVQNAIENNFIGKIVQIPPIYSALKIGGKALYKIARKDNLNEEEIDQIIKSKQRIVEIFKFDIISSSITSPKDIEYNKYLLSKNGENIKSETEIEKLEQIKGFESVKLMIVDVEIECSTGTYIRSLARDLASKLNASGYLLALERYDDYGYQIN